MEYAIVDIETTGGHASGNGTTEVCIHLHDGEKVFKQYETLINPQAHIPYYITGLTGITNEMVKNAPPFSDVAKEIFELLNNRVFVAHSVNFDYSFLKNALKQHEYELNCKKLCTVRLSRKIFPGFSSYSLGNLCGSLEIPLNNRHRAGGDAAATVILFEKLLQADSESIFKFLKRGSKEQALPPNLPKAEFEKLPDTPGVYYFLNKKGKVVYVGKAVNLKKRVSIHFTNNSPAKQKQDFMREIFHLRFTVCENEQEALALETEEIKKLWPQFNKAQKGYVPLFGIVHYEDQNGFSRLGLKKLKSKREAPVLVRSILEGHELLRSLVAEHELCLRLAGISKSREHCIETNCVCGKTNKRSVSAYNRKVKKALDDLVLVSEK
ncbi:MAG: exonuclease domain-containing protein [Bacteroidetes bacterium]|nr:exonuclease domain-containing protein [Bacteroidota bacterium]